MSRIRPALLVVLVSVLAGVSMAPASATPAASAEPVVTVVVDRNLEIPTQSGHVLRADLYRPAIDGIVQDDLPTVVTYFPYVKDDETRFEVEAMQRFARDGYAGLLVDIAGTGASPGTFGFFSRSEIADGRDAVDWAADQEFSNGRTGLWGYSYPGVAAAHIAATQPPSVKAVVPASTFSDPYRDVMAPGGILTTQDAFLLPFLAAFNVARQRPTTDPAIAFETLLDSAVAPGGLVTLGEVPLHLYYDDFWKERALENKLDRITAPTLMWSGWSDIYPRATLLNHHMIGADHVGLVMGPWGHLAGAQGIPLALFLDESVRWFDTFLQADPTPAEADAAVVTKIFDIDWTSDQIYADTWPGEFVDLPTWPPAVEQRELQLCGDTATPDPSAPWLIQGRLAAECTEASSLPVLPLPVDATGAFSIGHDIFANPFANELFDDKDQRLSTDSTVFLTDPLDEPMTVTGAMQLSLTAETLGLDADWIVRAIDVGPERTRVVAPGWLRASRRTADPDRGVLWHTHAQADEQRLTPGERYDMDIELWPSSYVIPAGHRFGVLLRTSDTIKVTPGPTQVLSNVILGPDAQSFITFPVRPAASGPAATVPSTPTPDTGDTVTEMAPEKDTAQLPATGGHRARPGFVLIALAALVLAARSRRPMTDRASTHR